MSEVVFSGFFSLYSFFKLAIIKLFMRAPFDANLKKFNQDVTPLTTIEVHTIHLTTHKSKPEKFFLQ